MTYKPDKKTNRRVIDLELINQLYVGTCNVCLQINNGQWE